MLPPPGVKLIIQIPCFNEEQTLAVALAALPTSVAGFDCVEWLVIDDGSLDRTSEIAAQCGVHHVVRHPHNMGLARAFMTGIEACLELGADVIVNTDADNQYDARDIPALVKPVLDRRSDIVIGARPISGIQHFSFVKKLLQRLGSFVVRALSGTDVQDAPSGFRAFSRSAAQRLNVFSEYTYTLETLILAGQRLMAVQSVPIRVNKDLRPSRLVKSITSYVRKSMFTLLRVFIIYHPFRFFMAVGTLLSAGGFAIGCWFLSLYFRGAGQGHIQSLILASVLLGMGFQTYLVAFVAELLSVNRRLLEDLRYTLHRDRDERRLRSP